MGCGSSSLKGEPVADIGSAPAPVPVELKKPAPPPTQFNDISYEGGGRKKSLRPDRAPHEQETPRVSDAREKDAVDLRRREAKKTAYHDSTGGDVDTDMNQAYPHEKYHSGSEHRAYREEHERNSIAKYRSGSEHEKYRSEHEREHQKHEKARKERRADEGLSDEQTGFINSADQMKNENAAGESRKKSFLAKLKGDPRQGQFSDEELLKYTGMTNKQIQEEARKGSKAPDQLRKAGSAPRAGDWARYDPAQAARYGVI